MAEETTGLNERKPKHGIVIPLYGACPPDLAERVISYRQKGMLVVLVQNNPKTYPKLTPVPKDLLSRDSRIIVVYNHNVGGVAGGFNRGIESAIRHGMEWITLLDQDSRLSGKDMEKLLEPWQSISNRRLMAGPIVWDGRRECFVRSRNKNHFNDFIQTRLLISSGTTFRTVDWDVLGPMDEWLFVDFVDHFWSFKAQAQGFVLLQHPDVILHQAFGEKHPNPLCHQLGMELYSPVRHFYSIRNLRYLARRSCIPLDLKLKELLKMLFKPWLWLLFEPQRNENLKAIIKALRTPIPKDGDAPRFRL
jgi:rhamnosyltransferase